MMRLMRIPLTVAVLYHGVAALSIPVAYYSNDIQIHSAVEEATEPRIQLRSRAVGGKTIQARANGPDEPPLIGTRKQGGLTVAEREAYYQKVAAADQAMSEEYLIEIQKCIKWKFLKRFPHKRGGDVSLILTCILLTLFHPSSCHC